MKFDLHAKPSVTPGSSSAEGSFDVMPEAVHAILNDIQAMAEEFDDLLMQADMSVLSLAEACKAQPVSRELTTFNIFLLRRTLLAAAGRTGVAVSAVSEAVLALLQADEQMSDTARHSAALAAQERVDDAPGAAKHPRHSDRGPAQAF